MRISSRFALFFKCILFCIFLPESSPFPFNLPVSLQMIILHKTDQYFYFSSTVKNLLATIRLIYCRGCVLITTFILVGNRKKHIATSFYPFFAFHVCVLLSFEPPRSFGNKIFSFHHCHSHNPFVYSCNAIPLFDNPCKATYIGSFSFSILSSSYFMVERKPGYCP